MVSGKRRKERRRGGEEGKKAGGMALAIASPARHLSRLSAEGGSGTLARNIAQKIGEADSKALRRGCRYHKAASRLVNDGGVYHETASSSRCNIMYEKA